MAKHLFRSGDPKRGGRQKGTPNRRTAHGREFAERLCNDTEYLANLEARAKTGKLPPGVEVMLWYYAHAKPREHVELSGSVGTRDVREMSTEELLAEIEQHQPTTAELLTQHHGQRHAQGD